MEVEKKGGGSFPSNYLTIQQLRQRWLQQQSSSSSSLLLSPVVISESNHRDNDDDDVECCAASSSKKKTQNDAVSPPVVTKSLSYNNNNKASSKPNQQHTLSPISSSSGGSMKKPQNDAVSPPLPPAKAKSPPPPAKTDAKSKSTSSSNNNNNKPTLISEEKHDNEIVSFKTLTQSVGACHYKRGGGRNPNRLLTPQKPKPEPEPKDTATIINTYDDSGANDDVDNHINNKKKSIKKKSRKAKGVFPVSGPEIDPKLDPEVEVVVAEKEKEESRRRRKSDNKESKMGLGLEVEVKQKRDNKVGRGFKDKRASWFHHQNNKPAVEPEKMEMDVETVVMVDKRQKPRGRRDLDNKAVWEFKPKTTSFGHKYNSNSNLVDDNVDVKAVEVDKVVDVDVVKEKSRRGYRHQGQRQGKQTLKACSSFDHDKDVKESDAAGDGERRIFGRFHRQGIRRPLLETGKGKVWVKKTPTPTSSFHSF